MNDLIIEQGTTFEIEPATQNKLILLEQQIKRLTDLRDEIRDTIMNEMEYKGIYKLENDELALTYLQENERESFDTVRFKKEHYNLYSMYIKKSRVKPSLRIRVKEKQ